MGDESVAGAAGERQAHPDPAAAGEAILAKVRWRLLPFLILLFLVSYLDRVNVSFAKLTMDEALGISDAVYAFGAGIFFIGYFLFEVPSNLILERVGARRWIARIMLTWGVISAATAFITGAKGFVVMRFMLGVAEAGFFPGIILYLTRWFPDRERAGVVGLFMVAIPLSGLVGSPLSGLIMDLKILPGLAGWQQLLLLEGLPAVALGFVCLKVLPDGPQDAKWLEPAERQWLAQTLEEESANVRRIGHSSLRAAFTQPGVWLLALAYFGDVLALYGLGFWLPTVIHNYGLPLTEVGWITALPFACGAPFMIWVTRNSDRTRERVWHLTATCALGFIGFAGASVATSLGLQLVFLCMAAMGVYGVLPLFWTFPSVFLTGTAAAAGLALINSVGNLGGYFGPQIVAAITRFAGGFGPALFALGISLTVPAIVIQIMARRR